MSKYLKIAEKVAQRYLKDASGKRQKRIFSVQVFKKIRRAFGKRDFEMFLLYRQLRGVYYGTQEAPEEGFPAVFRNSAMRIRRKMVREDSAKKLRDRIPNLVRLLKRLEKSGYDSEGQGFIWKEVIEQFVDIIQIACRDRDLFFKKVKLKYPGWVRFIQATDSQEDLERLKRDDPELYEIVKREKKIQKQLDREIEKAVVRAGLKPGTTKFLGKPYITGTDPKSGEELVFLENGDVLYQEEAFEKRKEHLNEMKALRRVFPDDLDDFRKHDDELVDLYAEDQTPEYVALTDDKEKQNSLTRIYPVIDVEDDKVVSEGRFKGFVLEDLVNREGRLIEGTAYDYDPKLGRPVPLEKRKDGKLLEVNLRQNREPYITQTEHEQLYVKIPSTHEYTDLRNALYELSKVSPEISYAEGTRRAGYHFSPDEFGAVRDALKSVAMSKGAMRLIREHFEELAKSELAVQQENLEGFDADSLGNFDTNEFFPDLYTKQKQALAWLEDRGGNGLVALDTGTGKTLTTLAYIQNMKREGLLEGSNKVLYVCPAALRGNLKQNAKEFLKDVDATMDLVDEISYAELSRSSKSIMDRYEAVIFDEAHKLKNVANTKRGEIVNQYHPRKVLMTASPMERDPVEMRKLSAIANNEDMYSAEGRDKVRLFEKRFCEKIGSRVVGVKEDSQTKRDLQVWVKQNLFYAHKQDIEEYILPSLRSEDKAVNMPEPMENLYRRKASKIKDVLKGMERLYIEKDPEADSPEITGAMVSLAKEINELSEISNMPEKFIPGIQNPKIEEASDIIRQRIESRGRTIMWAKSPDFARHSVAEISKKFPGMKHAVCLSGSIEIWRSGRQIEKYTKKIYRKPDGEEVDPRRWKKHVVDTYIRPTTSQVNTCILTDSYATGYNLQTFDTVIHLERADNAEISRQRTSRTYRNGQQNSVQEITLDATYSAESEEDPASIDEIKQAIQNIEESLFRKIIMESQAQSLGKEFFEMKKLPARTFEEKRKIMEMMLSPYIDNVKD